ncbi:MAG: hypothetical protein ABJF11_01050 [Reichenbachiella sp.]|uniref:hypothetical protein n=1 Tax=Reichenbachiella sp. TaxID=2184521 RepID=UPI0032677F28
MVSNERVICSNENSGLYRFENRISKVKEDIVLWKETEETFEKKIPDLNNKFEKLISGCDRVDVIFDITEINEIRLTPIQRKLCRKFFERNQKKLSHAFIVTDDQTFLRLTSKLLMRNYFELITFHRSVDEALEVIDLSKV